MSPSRPARPTRQTLLGSVHGRRARRTGLRKNLATQAKAGLDGLLELHTRILAHNALEKLKCETLCGGWDTYAKPFQIENRRRCPLCDSDFTNLGKHITAKHLASIAKFKCEVAGFRKALLTKNARTTHMKNAHGIGVAKTFDCPHFSSCNL